MKVIFLHIPKTAGQSVHAALVRAFGKDSVCPARVNDQLRKMTISELNRYRVFSGHLDWSMLDCIKGPKYIFTILREPMDRILSFYFYLREEAKRVSRQELKKPERQGLRAALQLSPKEYFVSDIRIRQFIDDHYDNFYTYYFAGRHYRARSELVALVSRGEISYDDVLKMAIDNLSRLDDVFTIDNMSNVFSMIKEISGEDIGDDEQYYINVNTKLSAQKRRDSLLELGADMETIAKLESFCRLDNQLWSFYSTQ